MIRDNAPAHRGPAMRSYLETPGLNLRLVNPRFHEGRLRYSGVSMGKGSTWRASSIVETAGSGPTRRLATGVRRIRIIISLGMGEQGENLEQVPGWCKPARLVRDEPGT